MKIIFKVLLNLLQYCFCLMLWFFGTEIYGSLTRDRILALCFAKPSLDHRIAKEVPACIFCKIIQSAFTELMPLSHLIFCLLWTLSNKRNEHSAQFHFISLYFIWPSHMACRILVPRPVIEPRPLAVKARSLKHWNTREFQVFHFRDENTEVQWRPEYSHL